MRRISRLRRTSQAILVGWLVLAAIFETGAIVGIRGSTSAPLPPQNVSGSWNPNVSCTPLQVRISDITANQTQTASYQSSPFTPGITTPVTGGVAKRWLTPGPTPPGWVSPGPPCTKSSPTGTTILLVELDGVERND